MSKSAQPSIFTFKIGGEAGYGVMSAGLTFSKFAVRSGYYIFDYTEYPSLVRGGHNVMQVTVSNEPVRSQYFQTDFLVALNQETIDLHLDELVDGSQVLYDSDRIKDLSKLPEGVHKIPVPLTQLVKDAKVSMIMRNTIALAASVTLLGGDIQILIELLEEAFSHKNDNVIELNRHACQTGHDYMVNEFEGEIHSHLKKRESTNQIVVTGNEAVALGAIAGGMNFAAIYPMTPTSNILHTLAPHQEEYGFIYKQPEDEISAINMAIGAFYAGARPMVATSGGGFALMSEALGLAGLTESGVVIVEGMRGAPATGLPTWTEQGDLRFVLHAHQGDFPRIVLAAGDMEESFELSMLAFNLIEKYQTPVILLIDKYVCESHMSIPPFDYSDYELTRGKFTTEKVKDFKRFELSKDGISTRSIPGLGNHFVANSDEHNEYGYSNEEIDNRNEQMNKRMQKIQTCIEQDMVEPILYGPEDAEITLVSWGSNKGPILEALKQLDNVNYLHITWMLPFPSDSVKKHLEKAKHIVNIECNYSAQMGGWIAQNTGIAISNNLLKFDGRPFYPREIIEKVRSLK